MVPAFSFQICNILIQALVFNCSYARTGLVQINNQNFGMRTQFVKSVHISAHICRLRSYFVADSTYVFRNHFLFAPKCAKKCAKCAKNCRLGK